MKAATHPAHLPAVDAYIAKSAPFAQPLLAHLREVVHEGAPACEEAMKWSRPFFVYQGIILGNISAFKEHCSFGLWGEETVAALREAGAVGSNDGMGTFGKIKSLEDLPPREQLVGFVKKAVELIDAGTRTVSFKRPQKVAKPAEVPAALTVALAKNKAAAKAFAAMSASCQREYSQWIDDAKREETRDKRVAQALEWIAEGKSRNWKYE